MKKIIVVAKTKNNVIGADNDLVVHLPADLEHFYKTIRGQYLLTGRQSYESDQGNDTFHLGKKTVVLTRKKEFKAEQAIVQHSVEAAFRWAEKDGAAALYILGGASIYKQTIADADQLIVTNIDVTVDGDSFFPAIDLEVWKETKRIDCEKDAVNIYDYSFVWYEKRP